MAKIFLYIASTIPRIFNLFIIHLAFLATLGFFRIDINDMTEMLNENYIVVTLNLEKEILSDFANIIELVRVFLYIWSIRMKV